MEKKLFVLLVFHTSYSDCNMFVFVLSCWNQWRKNIFGGIPECSCVEDGEFTLPAALTTEDISEMESKYHVTVEKNQYANYESGAYTLRCFSKTEKVNVYRVVEGEDATAENEVLLSKNFAEANSIQIGDKIQLFDSEFTVTGFAERPDYLFMLENLSDSYHNDSEFGLVILPDAAMDSLPVQVRNIILLLIRRNRCKCVPK